MKLGVAINETWAFFQEIYDYFGTRHQTQLYVPRPALSLPLVKRLNPWLAQREYAAFLKAQDAVFFEWAGELLAQASQIEPRVPLITRLHRYEMYQRADQIQWDNVARVILVSHAKQREFARRFPAHADKTVVIPEGVSLTKFQPHGQDFRGQIGILCHLTPRKRVYELILAFSELARHDPRFTLHIGGDEHARFGDYYEALQRLVERLNLGERVIFYGAVRDTQSWYQQIDIFISNSYSEGLQVSPMEAMASGCYALSHAWDGADELLPLEDVYFTDGEMIEKILAYRDLSAAGRAARRAQQLARVQSDFSIERVKTQILAVVEETVQIHARKGGA